MHDALSPNSRAARDALVTLAHRYHGMGWLFGTSGNLSSRFLREDGRTGTVITASGHDKGALNAENFVELDQGTMVAGPAGEKPSAETTIHLAIYRSQAHAEVVLHVHSLASTLIRPSSPLPTTLSFSGLEMIKGWGLWEEGATAELPVFANHADVPTIANEIYAWLEEHQSVPALLIQGHGLTAWGDSISSAHRHLEVAEFLCRVHQARAHSTSF